MATLTVKGRAPKTGYSREQFGQAWFDSDRNGCDTRNDLLRRDLKKRSMKNSCKVLAGTLTSDPYTAKQVRFVYGGPSEVDIDHVIALSDAWQKGAAKWAPAKRVQFANDPLNLLAVSAGANRSKGDGDTATWLPLNKSFRCAYVARQVAVKARYGVWVTAAERDAMVRVLSVCPTQKLPTSKAIPLGGGTIVATPSTPTPTAPASTKPSARLDPDFGTCREAIDAGYGPYYEGKDPEYDWYRDADSDGIVCEP
ncbi:MULTISPECIES: GmrSD restriction endonuclease domain-containing protein [unclassified Knoellia]|uniref:GmrSD restriction endonuclease domain-containing protein n=1 Tax=Knoellia altitudinis TaxID=3404795 RepID=UPI00362159B6